MLRRNYRLKEKEVKKVLSRGKPFFSYWVVLNQIPNLLWYPRFSIVIWSKSVTNNITRNFFRRRFYDLVSLNILNIKARLSYDNVFIVKKNFKLDKKDKNTIEKFYKDINFLIRKWIFKNY